jgi:hypothetical protein
VLLRCGVLLQTTNNERLLEFRALRHPKSLPSLSVPVPLRRRPANRPNSMLNDLSPSTSTNPSTPTTLPQPLPTVTGASLTMPLVRPTTGSGLVRSAKASKQSSVRNTKSATRHLSTTSAKQAGHAPQYDPPTGWLFGVQPGTKPKKEGWENLMIYGYGGGIVAVCVAYMFKPDTRFVVFLREVNGS